MSHKPQPLPEAYPQITQISQIPEKKSKAISNVFAHLCNLRNLRMCLELSEQLTTQIVKFIAHFIPPPYMTGQQMHSAQPLINAIEFDKVRLTF